MKKTLSFLIILILISGNTPLSAQSVRSASITSVEGSVEVSMQSDAGTWHPAEVGMVLHENDEVRTKKNAAAVLQLDEGDAKTGKLELQENSRLRLSTLQVDDPSGDQETLLDLALGKVTVHAKKLKGKSKFEVRTPTSIVTINGAVVVVAVE